MNGKYYEIIKCANNLKWEDLRCQDSLGRITKYRREDFEKFPNFYKDSHSSPGIDILINMKRLYAVKMRMVYYKNAPAIYLYYGQEKFDSNDLVKGFPEGVMFGREEILNFSNALDAYNPELSAEIKLFILLTE